MTEPEHTIEERRMCSLCSRYLDDAEDPLSIDCGGDCIACMITIEFEMGHRGTGNIDAVKEFIEARKRAEDAEDSE